MACIRRNNTAFFGRRHTGVIVQLVEWCPQKRSRSASCLALCRILRRQMQRGLSYPHHIMLCLTFTSSAQTRHDPCHNVYDRYFAVLDKHTLHTLQSEAKKKSTCRKFFPQSDANPLSDSSHINNNGPTVKTLYFTLTVYLHVWHFSPNKRKLFPLSCHSRLFVMDMQYVYCQ
jgi:hypothetical protein